MLSIVAASVSSYSLDQPCPEPEVVRDSENVKGASFIRTVGVAKAPRPKFRTTPHSPSLFWDFVLCTVVGSALYRVQGSG